LGERGPSITSSVAIAAMLAIPALLSLSAIECSLVERGSSVRILAADAVGVWKRGGLTMNIHEFQAKNLLSSYGLSVPPGKPIERRPCPPDLAVRLSGARHCRGDHRRSPAPVPDRQAVAARDSLCLGRPARRIRVCSLNFFDERADQVRLHSNDGRIVARRRCWFTRCARENETPKLARRDRRRNPDLRPRFCDTQIGPRAANAPCSRAFPAKTQNHANTMT
jgi:hypothetical protein